MESSRFFGGGGIEKVNRSREKVNKKSKSENRALFYENRN